MDKRYFTIDDTQNLIYFQLPKVLMVAERYEKMSNDAKLLYVYYLDLNTRSMRSGWKDEDGRYYIKFSDEKAMKFIHCAKQKMSNLKKELRKFGLIETKKTGQGYVDIQYVLKLHYTDADVYEVEKAFEDVVDNSNEIDEKAEVRKSNSSTESRGVRKSSLEKYENQTSRSMKIKLLEVRKSNSITKNYSSNTPFINNTFIDSSSLVDTDNEIDIEAAKQEEEEVKLRLTYLGNEIAKSEIMITDKQINDTLNIMFERRILDFDNIDIENAIAHYKNECITTTIGQPPVFFVNGFEITMSRRRAMTIGNKEQMSKSAPKNDVKVVPFYNWLEQRD